VPAAVASAARPLSTAELEAVVRDQAGQAHPLHVPGNSAGERTGARVFQSTDYDVWLLRWPPDTRVTPHDHGDSAGAFMVVQGELMELRWHGSAPACRLVTAGETVSIERGVVHDVVATKEVAYSLHAYSPPLEAMSFYEVPAPTPQLGGSSSEPGRLSAASGPTTLIVGG
jgi:quercetin dioxygenase-like cupin family protein